MPKRKKASLDTKKVKESSGRIESERICFVISPIGTEGTKRYSEFKEILEYIIRPAFEESQYKYSVVRADEINRSGSFIKDILEQIYASHIVIADLTGQNPNVFYELGVRHSLRSRTILIAQSLDDIPSDLREYRTLIYDTTAKGATNFKKRISEFLKEIEKDPERADNPVIDRLGSITENKLGLVERERDQLKEQLSKALSGKKVQTGQKIPSKSVKKRFERILALRNAKMQLRYSGGHIRRGEKEIELPTEQGEFYLNFLLSGTTIEDIWYVSVHPVSANIDEELADIRVLMENCSRGQETYCDFIIVTGSEVPNKEDYQKKFNTMKRKLPKGYPKFFKLHILDPPALGQWEKEYALKV